MAKQLLAGIDIGGTKTAVVLSQNLPEILTRFEFPTRPDLGVPQTISGIHASLNRALQEGGFSASDLQAIGISCGGPLDAMRGVIQSPPNLPQWDEVPICRIVEHEFGAPCFLENDANAGALAEAAFGAGRGFKHLIFLTMGTGIGAGIILNGELLRGASHSAGEIGHVRLTSSGPCAYGKTGSVEAWASGAGMAQLAEMHLKAARESGNVSTLHAEPTPTARAIREAAHAGDVIAKAIVREVGERLGSTLAILIDILNPECITIGGLALRFGEELLGPAREVVQREALPDSARICRIVPSGLGERIGDVAALCAAVQGMATDNIKIAQRESNNCNLAGDSRIVGLD